MASGLARSEQPAILGGPYTPAHTASRKIGYLATGITVALLGTFGNGPVTTRLPAVAGEYGISSGEVGLASRAGRLVRAALRADRAGTFGRVST